MPLILRLERSQLGRAATSRKFALHRAFRTSSGNANQMRQVIRLDTGQSFPEAFVANGIGRRATLPACEMIGQ
jgi:hypothetical protein